PPNALRLQIVRELARLCHATPEEVAQLCALGTAPAPGPMPARRAAPALPRRPHPSLAQRILQLLVLHPACAEAITGEQRALLDGPEFAPIVALLDQLKGAGIATAAGVIEATRDMQHAALYEQAAAGGLLEAYDD